MPRTKHKINGNIKNYYYLLHIFVIYVLKLLTMEIKQRKSLHDLIDPDWADALKPVEPQVHKMGDFLRDELSSGRRFLPESHNILRAFTIPF